MNNVRSNNHSLKYQRLTSLDRRNIGIRLFEFVAKSQFLLKKRFKICQKVYGDKA